MSVFEGCLDPLDLVKFEIKGLQSSLSSSSKSLHLVWVQCLCFLGVTVPLDLGCSKTATIGTPDVREMTSQIQVGEFPTTDDRKGKETRDPLEDEHFETKSRGSLVQMMFLFISG